MFEMETIGKKIASLRKASNRTQQDLADQLGVTYQAVSNWERGLSMPDVARLKDLARLFEVSLDELMGSEEATKVVEVATGDRPAGTVQDLLDSAPYMKPKTLEEEIRARAVLHSGPAPGLAPSPDEAPEDAPRQDPKEFPDASSESPGREPARERAATAEPKPTENIPTASLPLADEADGGDPQGEKITFREILAFAPFISSDLIHELIREEMEQDPDFDYSLLTPLAPFLEQEHLRALSRHFLSDGARDHALSHSTLLSLLPHLDSATLAELAQHALDSEEASPLFLIQLAPFLDQATLGCLTLKGDETNPLPDTSILSLAPFLAAADLRALMDRRKPLSELLRMSLIPFLHGEQEMEEMVRDFMARGRKPRDK